MGTRNAIGGPWRGPDGPRVLFENADLGVGYALERLLIERGYATAVCEGPDCRHSRRCALVETGRCDLVSNADVIVHSLDLDRWDQGEVLQALRGCYPAARTVVEISEPSVARHRELLEGCTLLPFPATRSSLTSAVEASLGRLALGYFDRWPGHRQPPAGSVTTDVTPTVTAYLVGPITSTERAYAEQKIAYVLRFASVLAPVADLELRYETDPGWERPALAKVTVDVNGRRVRVYADAATMFVAVDAIAARLHRRLEELGRAGGASP
jgi:ribosome-associated translation inhibitor RaiA